MRKFLAVALAGTVVAATLVGSGAPTSAGAPAREQASAAGAARPDNHPGPLTARQEGRRKAAQQLILSGQASPDADGVVQLAEDKYFQAAVTGTGRVSPSCPSSATLGSGKLGRDPGPLHNQIPEPDRTRRQLHALGGGLQQVLLRGPLLRFR